MFKPLLSRSNSVQFSVFLESIKAGERDFFEALKTPRNHFADASFDELMSNTDDVLSGVNRVQKNFSDIYFGLFGNCLIKHHDNGDVKWIFYTVTSDHQKILEAVNTMTEKFGPGLYDDGKFTPFTKKEKIIKLAEGLMSEAEGDILTMWLHEDITALFQYRTAPQRQFSLMITIRKEKVEDTQIRRRTILELIQSDIEMLASTSPIKIEKTLENGSVKFTDLTYVPSTNVLRVFDRVSLRQFGEVEGYERDKSTNLTLFSAKPIRVDNKLKAAEQIIQLYGPDNGGTEEIAFHERDMLEAGEFWTGRTWYMNEQHAPWNSENNENMAYLLTVDDFADDQGFKVSIISFNTLLELFSMV